MQVYLKQGTEQHPTLPIVKAFFDFKIDLSTEDFYKIMYTTEVRKKWDKVGIVDLFNIAEPTEDVCQYYMCNHAPWPFTNREFLETRYTRRRQNGDIEVFFQNLDDNDFKSPIPKCERAITYLGGQIMRNRVDPTTGETTLLITQMCQADLKGNITPKLVSITLPMTFIKWYNSLRKVLVHFKETGEL